MTLIIIKEKDNENIYYIINKTGENKSQNNSEDSRSNYLWFNKINVI